MDRVGASGYPLTPPSEPCVKVSLHTARIWQRPIPVGLTRGAMKPETLHERLTASSGNLAILDRGREHCLALDGSAGTHPATCVAGHLLFPVNTVPPTVLALPDQTDVGISGALHPGLSFFGPLNAAPSALPYGWGGHGRAAQDSSFSMFRIRHRRI